jgi:hypothetical protein
MDCRHREALDYVLFHRKNYIEYLETEDDPFYKFTCKMFPSSNTETFPLTWPSKYDAAEYDPIEDLLQTIWITIDTFSHDRMHLEKRFKELQDWYMGTIYTPMHQGRKRYPGDHNRSEYTQKMQDLSDKLESFQTEFLKLKVKNRDHCSDSCIIHLLDQSYLRVMDENPSRLNRVPMTQGKQFLYGELKPHLIESMLRNQGIIPLKSLKNFDLPLFFDMGSGIGNVILQVAAMSRCKAIGIEILPLPFKISLLLKTEFISRLNLFGYKDIAEHIHNHVELIQGNFLEHPRVHTILENVDTVLVNNFTFGSDLNQGLMDLFLNLPEGAKVVSLMNFTPLRKRMTDYHRHRPSAIFNIKQVYYPPDSVSWSSSGGSYYIHTVDRIGLSRDLDFVQKKSKK